MAYTEYAAVSASTYALYAVSLPAVQAVLYSTPEVAVQQIPAAKSSYVPFVQERRESVYSTAFQTLEGGDKQDKWQVLVNAVKQSAPGINMLEYNAKWEGSDPGHRVSMMLTAAYDLFEKKFPKVQGRPDFYKWLDSIPEWERVVMLSDELRKQAFNTLDRKGPAWMADKANQATIQNSNLRPSLVKAFVKGVAYLDKATRKNYRVKLEGGTARWKSGEVFDTWNMKTVFSGRGFAIWVMSPEGKLYAGNHIYGQFHHSSFLSGGAVLSAGEIKSKNGKIEFITAKSGHYQPSLESLISAVETLQRQSVDVASMRVGVWRNNRFGVLPGDNFRARSQGCSAWGGIAQNIQDAIRNSQWNLVPAA